LAAGGIAILAVGIVGFVGYALVSRPHIAAVSSAQRCANQPHKLASLFSDGQTTMLRLSNLDYTEMRILRTEPANVLPGMFDALLALSGDDQRLAYVTASDELMDDAHVEYVDVANPSVRTELAAIAKGFWVVRPAWSPDNRKLAYVTMSASSGAPPQFELWIADTTTQPVSAAIQADLVADNFTNGHSASICWTADKRVVLVPTNSVPFPSPSPTGAAPSPEASVSPSTGSPCGVPIYSQNDPAWRDVIMQSGSDSIGGAGCALTTAAMMLNYYGAAFSPAQLNSCLGGGADPIVWKSVPSCTKGLISGGDRIDFTWTDLDALLASGRPAIVGLLRGQTGSHFVVVTSGGGGLAQNYRITDPWDATTSKTLGSYINAGYNPRWIISYGGPGRNCGRLIKGGTPSVSGVTDGGTGKDPVTIHLAPNLKYLKLLQLVQLSWGAIAKDTFNQPVTVTKIAPGATVSDEGIYMLMLVTQAPSNPPRVELYRFTIDRTAPIVDLTLLNPRQSGDVQSQVRASGAAPARSAGSFVTANYPVIDRPGKISIVSSDTLSGLAEIKYNLDGTGLLQYSSDTSFSRVLIVAAGGDHMITMQSIDAAGNMKEVTKYFTVYVPPPPVPTPTHAPPPPPPPPPTCPTRLALGNFTAQPVAGVYPPTVDISWSSSGGCSPFSGSIVGNYAGQPAYKSYAITAQQGALRDQPPPPFTCPSGTFTVIYTFTLKDKVGQTITSTQRVNVTWQCIL